MIQPELIWMLAGERLSEGLHMYKDVVDDTGPLSVGAYWVIHLIFGRSLVMYKLLAALLIIFQIAYINALFIRYKSFEENTYIPAAVMVVLFHLSFDLLTLSPSLMGGTFLIMALGQLYAQTVLQKEGSDSVLLAGMFGGVAVLFHFPLIVFLPFLVVAGIAISGFTFRQFILSLFGYFLPIFLCALYYFWIDSLPEFVLEYLFASRIIDVYTHVSLLYILLAFALPLILAMVGYLVGLLFKMITVNQQKQRQLIFLYLIFAILSILLTNRQTPYQFIIILPALTYFITQIFIYLSNKKALAIFSFILFLGVPASGYLWLVFGMQSGQFTSYIIEIENKHEISKGKSIVVLGDDIAYYKHATLATPYLNQKLSKRILNDFDDFADMASVYQQFLIEQPELIIDQEGLFADLLVRIPLLSDLYQIEEEGLYRLRK
ncbi:hypothetical protein SAMN06295967_107116 [Belliella buryatensis]|uniref:Dolichyl-phosphate-mannose-protein mannosyltransferase n=2 Tax=Belliella buryatensis TaxID=1500549 RepID=A0A239DKE7_9BACT|nr:hypothetical protein SAMN06295967_107116 [Belliella buryatensis]